MTTATEQVLLAPRPLTTRRGVADVRANLQRVYLPAIGVTAVALYLSWRGWARLSGVGPLHAVRSAQFQLAGPVVLGFVAAVVICERLWPAQARPLDSRGHRMDALYFFVHAVIGVPIMVLAGTGFSAVLAQHFPWLVLPRLPMVPRAAFVVLAIVGIDLFDWFAHYGSHRLEPLWRLHSVHHSQEELSILSTFRTHPLVHLGFVVTAIPVLVLAGNNATPAFLLTAFACFGALPHANVRWSYGRVGRWIISPTYHRIHHRPTGRLDINIGTIFTVWDRMTGRAIFPDPAMPAPRTGLDAPRSASEFDAVEPRYFRTLAGQLAGPFITNQGRQS